MRVAVEEQSDEAHLTRTGDPTSSMHETCFGERSPAPQSGGAERSNSRRPDELREQDRTTLAVSTDYTFFVASLELLGGVRFPSPFSA